MDSLQQGVFVLLIVCLLYSMALALTCYTCDNSQSAACGQEFKAYQFTAEHCSDQDGVAAIFCGKQEQPPYANGWVGVIRSCYYPGTLPRINETVGCHQYFHQVQNFSALYCFCDTAYCNHVPNLRTYFTWMISILCALVYQLAVAGVQ